MKKIRSLILVGLLALASSRLWAKYEQEQLQMENQIQQRIEGILSRTLPSGSYLVTVKVEMENRERPASRQTTARRSSAGFSPNTFVLPGVPQKTEYAPPQELTTETSTNATSIETLVKRILINILVSNDVRPEQIRAVRDVISTSIPFNPLRGDELDIQNSPIIKTAARPASASGGAPAAPAPAAEGSGNSLSTMLGSNSAGMYLLLGAFLAAFFLFVAFLFGPVRAFLNRLLAVLPRIGEQAAYAVSNAPVKSPNGAGVSGVTMYSNGNGGGGDEDTTRPFRFIREDQLTKLPILFKGMSPAQCALVLAYLPAEWASKVLGALDPLVQTTIMSELSQAREVPPEVVNEIEDQIKSKLPYLVGGVDWIQSVYQLTQPQTQRALLGTINQQSPELAQSLRRKTFFVEDLGVISPGALRMVLQEAGYPTAAMALRDEPPESREAILKRLPVAMREILQQELDLAGDDKHAMIESKMRLLDVGRRMLADGRITLPERQ